MIAIFLVSGFYTFVASPPDGLTVGKDYDDRFVVMEYDDAFFLEESYNTSKEKAYCLYGHEREDSFYIEDVVLADISYSTNVSVSFSCFDPTWERREQLLKEPSYKILGTLHTHPNQDSTYDRYQSYVDTVSMAWNVPFYQLSGVHVDDETSFYTTESTNEDLEVVMR